MVELLCEFDAVRYPFYLATDRHDALVEALRALEADFYFVIAHPSLVDLGAGALARSIERFAPASVLFHPEGEVGKRLTAVEDLIEAALRHGATRRSCIVAFGGGITANVAGMVAALTFRGLRLVHVPTTLLGMLDTVISLKQAVNASVGKNMIGAYYAPALVFADTAYLRTLSRTQIFSGVAEIVKNALAISPSRIPLLDELLDGPLDDGALQLLVRWGIESKLMVMRRDPYEKHDGLVLEYGHTIGHAIELASRGSVSHGEGVAFGMRAAAEIARSVTQLPEVDVETHRRLIGRLDLSHRLPHDLTEDKILRAVVHDNKRGHLPHRRGFIPMILLEALGRPRMNHGLPLTDVPLELVERAVTTLAAEHLMIQPS